MAPVSFIAMFLVSMLAFCCSTVAAAAATSISIDYDGLRCKLPGWPGHPAPSCDPKVPDQCCAGTKCSPDPYDASHSTCQQTELFTIAEHALTASVLTSHVEFLVNNALGQLKTASLGLYLSQPEQKLKNAEIVQRAQVLSGNHGNIMAGGKGDEPMKGNSWHKIAHDQPARNPSQATTGKKGEDPSSFDYSKYNQGGKIDMDKAKKDDHKSSSSAGGQQQQGGFDYSKYIPAGKGPNAEDSKKKKDDSKAKPETHAPHKGDGGFDYSPYYRSEPHPEPTGKKDSSKKGSSSSSSGAYDYSQYVPKTSKNELSDADQAGAQRDADFLKNAALQLLQADLQLRSSSAEAKREVLERVKAILVDLEGVVDRELAAGPSPDPSDVNDDRLPDDQVGGGAQRDGGDTLGTLAPTTVWNDQDDFWRKYIPDMPNEQVNTGDRRPGSLGGPCGRTSYKDFGPCVDKRTKCVGLMAERPGICQMDRATVQEFSRQSAMNTLNLAEQAVATLRAATVELLVAASSPLSMEDKKADDGKDSESSTTVSGSMAMRLNETTALDIREYSASTLFVVVLGFSVIGYFCWVKGFGRRRSYNTIDGWGAAGERA